jgi:hypothetical protein
MEGVDTAPGRDEVVLFEPREGVPVSAQPELDELFFPPRRRLSNPWRWLCAVLGVVGLVWPGHPVGFVVPAMVAVGAFTGLVRAALRYLPRAELRALADSPVRRVDLTELRQAGRTVAFPLDAQWVVAKPRAADRISLARLRRVHVFGPSPGDRIGFVVPGGSGPRTARLADSPPEATTVPAATPPTEWPRAPKDDPAVQRALTTAIREVACAAAVLACALVLLVLGRPEANWAVVLWAVPALFLVLVVLTAVGDLNRMRRARRATRWGWTRVTVVDSTATTARMNLTARVDAPQGQVHLKVSGPASLVLAVRESGQLWLIGELHARRPMVVGIPEVPQVGRARGARPPRQAR